MYFRVCVQALFTEEFLVFGCPLVVFYQDAESDEIQFWLSAICRKFFLLLLLCDCAGVEREKSGLWIIHYKNLRCFKLSNSAGKWVRWKKKL